MSGPTSFSLVCVLRMREVEVESVSSAEIALLFCVVLQVHLCGTVFVRCGTIIRVLFRCLISE